MNSIIILLGAPGSGKGTQAKNISSYLSIPIISTGDMLRHEIKAKSKLGALIAPYLETGQLVPDELIIDLFKDCAGREQYQNGFISDGFPRTLDQAKAFDGVFLGKGLDLKVIFLDSSLEALLDRILGRLVCPDCGAVYHVKFNPPKEAGTCSVCSHVGLENRSDDTKDIVETRFNVYKDRIKPVLDYYGERVSKVNGVQSLENVFSDLKKSLSSCVVRGS